MNLRPLGDRVVIKPKAAEEKTAGGIFLPETASKERPRCGEVVAVGAGKVNEAGGRYPLEVKEGDVAYFAEYAGTEIKLDGEKYLIIRGEDLLAIE